MGLVIDLTAFSTWGPGGRFRRGLSGHLGALRWTEWGSWLFAITRSQYAPHLTRSHVFIHPNISSTRLHPIARMPCRPTVTRPEYRRVNLLLVTPRLRSPGHLPASWDGSLAVGHRPASQVQRRLRRTRRAASISSPLRFSIVRVNTSLASFPLPFRSAAPQGPSCSDVSRCSCALENRWIAGVDRAVAVPHHAV